MECLGFINSAVFDRKKILNSFSKENLLLQFLIKGKIWPMKQLVLKHCHPISKGIIKNQCAFGRCCRDPITLTSKQDRQVDRN